jgi:hypothetical protein
MRARAGRIDTEKIRMGQDAAAFAGLDDRIYARGYVAVDAKRLAERNAR